MSRAGDSDEDRGEHRPVPKDDSLRTGPIPPTAGWVSSLLPVVSYCCASIMMTVINKFVVSDDNFNMTFLLLTIQSSVGVSCVIIAKRLGAITFRDFDRADAQAWMPISCLLVCVIYTGSKSLQYLSIPVYTIFKNLTIILIAYGEVLWFGGNVTRLTLVSFMLMVVSSLIAAWSDITRVMGMLNGWGAKEVPTLAGDVVVPAVKTLATLNLGYMWMLLNCVASAAYVLSMRKKIKVTGFKDWDSMFYNNLLSIPVLVVFSLLIENWSRANLLLNFPDQTRNLLLFMMAFSGGAAVFISYTTAWCIRTAGATTYSMVGALNKLPVAASGMIFFGDPVNIGSVSAVGTGFVAGLVYALAKQNQSEVDKARAPGDGMIPMHNRRA